MHPNTDIVISLHATRQYPAETYFVKCIETLRANTTGYRLILVEDGCDDIGRHAIERVAQDLGVYLIHTPKQMWFTKAYNVGMRLVRTPHVVFLNADTELGAGWLEELYDVWTDFERQSGRKCGLVGSVLSGEEPRRWVESTGKDYVTAHCILASMQALFEVSNARGMPGWYLDETRPDAIHIRSDVYLSWEMNAAGWGTVKSFKSAVGHHGGKSWGHNLAAIAGLQLKDVAEEYK